MSTIKNGQELVHRADDHAFYDRIRQGTYGRRMTDGRPRDWARQQDNEVQYEGCALFCLSTPVDFTEENRSLWQVITDMITRQNEVDRDHQEDVLLEDFGICHGLQDLIEAIFEGLEFHGGAIEWVPEVAHALAACEGVTIRDAHIHALRTDHDLWRNANEGSDSSALQDAEWGRQVLLEWLDEKAPERPAPAKTVERKQPYDQEVREWTPAGTH